MVSFPTSHSEAEAWLYNFAESQDHLDATQTSEVYARDATLCFASFPPVQGAKNIEEMVADRFGKLDVIKHEPRFFDLVGSRLWASFNVTYRVKGDPAKENFVVPCVCVFSLVAEGTEGGKIGRVEIYMDQAAVAERMEQVTATVAS